MFEELKDALLGADNFCVATDSTQSKTRSLLKEVYDSSSFLSTKTFGPFSKLIVDNLDEESIWEEIQSRNRPLTRHLQKKIFTLTEKFNTPVLEETSNDTDDDSDNDGVGEDEDEADNESPVEEDDLRSEEEDGEEEEEEEKDEKEDEEVENEFQKSTSDFDMMDDWLDKMDEAEMDASAGSGKDKKSKKEKKTKSRGHKGVVEVSVLVYLCGVCV